VYLGRKLKTISGRAKRTSCTAPIANGNAA
jgi:hypothetical protein